VRGGGTEEGHQSREIRESTHLTGHRAGPEDVSIMLERIRIGGECAKSNAYASYPTQEPDAVTPLVRIREGAGRKGVLPRLDIKINIWNFAL